MVGREEDLSQARGKANAVARLAPLIREIGNSVERTHYIQILARLLQTDERLVAAEIDAAGREERTRARAEAAETTARPAGAGAPMAGGKAAPASEADLSQVLEDYVLGHLLSRSDMLVQLDAEMIRQNAPPLGQEDFTGVENRAILGALHATTPPDAEWTVDKVLVHLHEALHDRCRALVESAKRQPPLTDEKLAKDIGDSLLRLRAQNIHRQVNQLHFLVAESDQTGAREQLRSYYELLDSYLTRELQIHKLLNARTMTGALAQPSDRP